MRAIKRNEVHSDKVWSVSAHESLPLLVTASSDKTSKIIKLSASERFPVVSELEETHKRSVRSVAFRPPAAVVDEDLTEDPIVASGSFDSTISIWGVDYTESDIDEEDMAGNQKAVLSGQQSSWGLIAIIEGHENEIKSVDWNYTGQYLASCSRDKTVWIWETDPETLEEFECIAVLNDHQHDIKHIKWHPTMNLLASSSYDDTIRLYKQDVDEDDWSCVAILTGHEGTVWCSQFESQQSPKYEDGRIRLVSASDDLTVRLWSSKSNVSDQHDENALPSSLKHNHEMVWNEDAVLPQAHKYPVYSVAWSKKTGKIASAGSDGKIVIYEETESGWEISTIKESSHTVYEVNCIIWCTLEDGREVIASAGDDGSVNIWELDQ